jgi:hypothetical protein
MDPLQLVLQSPLYQLQQLPLLPQQRLLPLLALVLCLQCVKLLDLKESLMDCLIEQLHGHVQH